MKKWIINSNSNNEQEYHNIKLINNLLSSRGINDKAEIEDFLYPNINKLFNPFLLKDMELAIDRIDRAIKKRQKIVIYGDYDVDGITSTAILYRAFQKLGVDVNYYIPERMSEGYGINKSAIDYIKSLQTDLIITVDCGITSIDEVEYTKSLGMDIIVTDHHECRSTIPATIVINPKRNDCTYPNKCLAGCGIAFKLVQALWLRYNLMGFEEFLDIAAIGTVADIVELRGENRIIVKNGLAKINNSDKCGIKALKAVSEIGDNITSYNIAFQIAPRINAVGRLSDAKIAVELFVTNDYDKALQIAKFLDMENIMNDALTMVAETINLKKDKVIVLVSSNWHHGVVGIVASKLVERFSRPVILLCSEGESGLCRGSGRSIKGFNLYEGLSNCADIITKYGGHEMAAGLTIDIKEIQGIRNRLNTYGASMDAEIFLDKIYADAKTDTIDINMETAEVLKLFEPFGNANPSPVLYMENLRLLDMKGIGGNGQHLKLNLEKNDIKYNGILFNGSKEFLNKKLEMVDIIYNLEINEWKNNRSLQFMLKGMRLNTSYIRDNCAEDYFRYIRFMFSENKSQYNFSKVNFIKKDMEFFKEFVYFNKGYILVSTKEALKEIEFIFDYMNVNPNKNLGDIPQIIMCPRVQDIETFDNDVLVYDFLPGECEYEILLNKMNGELFNFYDENTLDGLDAFIQTITIDEEFIKSFLEDLYKSEITGTIKELSIMYNRNVFIIYKLIMLLKEKHYTDTFVKNDILKIQLKNNNFKCQDLSELQDTNVEKLVSLKIKLREYIEGE
jgi:single-stranded-DNA-specific exonuclease